MILELTDGKNILSFNLSRWNKFGDNLTASITPPVEQFPIVKKSYGLKLVNANKAVEWQGDYTYNDFVYQGFVDASGKDVVSVSDMNFSVTPALAPVL